MDANWNMGNCLNIRKHVFTAKVVEHRQRLPREVVGSPSSETFRTCLDAVLGSQLWLTPF